MNPSPPKREAAPLRDAAPIQTSNAKAIVRQPGMTYKEAAFYFGRHYRSIVRMVRAGKLHVVRTPAGPRVILEATP
jgi:excisionase family DNA binding protein